MFGGLLIWRGSGWQGEHSGRIAATGCNALFYKQLWRFIIVSGRPVLSLIVLDCRSIYRVIGLGVVVS